jgi:hypothetical protein
MFMLGNGSQPLEAFLGEPCRQSGELMTYPQVGETFTYSTEACDIVRLIGLRWLWSSEALDRQVGSLINVDDLVRIGLNVI